MNQLTIVKKFQKPLRELQAGSEFYRIRAGKLSANRYQKLGYNRANKAMGWPASFTCGRDDDISYSVELNPHTLVIPADSADFYLLDADD